MRKPDESLDEFVVKAVPPPEPPRTVAPRFTGEVEVLKPLAYLERSTKVEAAAFATHLHTQPNRLSWFHRSLIAGGACALGAVILASAIFIGIYDGDEAVQRADVSRETTEWAIASDAPNTNDFGWESSDADSTSSSDSRSVNRDRSVSRFKPRRQPLRPQYVVSDFTPTTLVIFIEKGEIKTRIEPQLKKPLTFSN